MSSYLVNAYSTLRECPAPDFSHNLRGQRDLSDPELAPHLQGFLGFVMRQEPQMTATLYGTIRHIQRVKNHWSFDVPTDQLDALAGWAWAANAILFMPDGTILNPSGQPLVNADGSPAQAELPFPDDALERRERSVRKLRERGVEVLASLPPVLGEGELTLRSPREVALRAQALMAVAARAESLNSGEPLSADAVRQRLAYAFDELSPVEREFMNSDAPEQQAIINHAWRYEALFVLEWALGLFDELPFPSEICDVPAVASAVLERGEALLEAPSLRPATDILDALDEHYRCHWVAREAVHNKKQDPPAGLHPGILQERRHALNWLTCFENADWDDVDTPT